MQQVGTLNNYAITHQGIVGPLLSILTTWRSGQGVLHDGRVGRTG